MRTWYRLRTAAVCGRCGEALTVGAVVLEIAGAGWKVRRCHRCASQQGESMPEHVAEAPTAARVIQVDFSERIASMRGLAKDWKHSQAND